MSSCNWRISHVMLLQRLWLGVKLDCEKVGSRELNETSANVSGVGSRRLN
jgi:hypothetical protein